MIFILNILDYSDIILLISVIILLFLFLGLRITFLRKLNKLKEELLIEKTKYIKLENDFFHILNSLIKSKINKTNNNDNKK